MATVVICHLVREDGTYLGSVPSIKGQALVIPHGATEVPSAPDDASQTWAEGKWHWPFAHYAHSSGKYAGVFERGCEPQDCTEIRKAPEDEDDQLWGGNNWQWQPHYFTDSDGKFVGMFMAGTQPEGSIETPAAPSSGSDTWDGEKWLPL